MLFKSEGKGKRKNIADPASNLDDLEHTHDVFGVMLEDLQIQGQSLVDAILPYTRSFEVEWDIPT